MRVAEGYNVQRRTSARTHIDGSREKASSNVTHLSIAQSPVDDDETQPSYEEVLDLRIRARQGGALIEEKVREAERTLLSATRRRVGRSRDRSPATDSAHRRSPVVRPASTVSFSGATDFEGVVVGAAPVQGDDAATPTTHTLQSDSHTSMRVVGRTKSGGASRPPPQKPNLHKTAAASGSSIGSTRSQQQNAEFISFTEQKPIQRDASIDTRQPDDSAAVIPPKTSSVEEVHTQETKEPPQQLDSQTVSAPAEVDTSTEVPESSDTAKPNVDIKYAFNIPTAGLEASVDGKRS